MTIMDNLSQKELNFLKRMFKRKEFTDRFTINRLKNWQDKFILEEVKDENFANYLVSNRKYILNNYKKIIAILNKIIKGFYDFKFFNFEKNRIELLYNYNYKSKEAIPFSGSAHLEITDIEGFCLNKNL